MKEYIQMTGMVLLATPVNDYDRRTVILTKERGKITAFCRGARRQGSKMMAVTNPFVFGTFKVYEGKDAYNLIDADISFYFEELRNGIISTNIDPQLSHGVESLKAQLAKECNDDNNDYIEMIVLKNNKSDEYSLEITEDYKIRRV